MSALNDEYHIIVIDDEEIVRHSMLQTLKLDGYKATAFENPLLAIEYSHSDWKGVVICDVRMNIMNGLEILEKILAIDKDIPVIMFSAHADISTVIRAVKLGAYDFLEKTDDPEHHLNTVKRACQKRQLVLENRQLKRNLTQQNSIEAKLIGQTPQISQLRQSTLQLAQIDVDLIIHGETGTGKEVIARCLHDFGPRSNKPFVAINCGALSENIIESELFGHETGAFTGATKRRIGKIEYASGGTLFLDEIESMPLSLQIKLLRVIQERTLQRLGGNIDIEIDIRIVAASKVDLIKESHQGTFREDLYYRLNVAALNIPSLDERKADIPLLFSHFAQASANRLKCELKPISIDLIEKLSNKHWPGNVRELQNTAERWVLGLPLTFDTGSLNETNERTKMTTNDNVIDFTDQLGLEEKIANHEINIIAHALKASHGHIQKTADLLKIPRKKLYLRMKRYQLDKQKYS